MLLNKNNHIKLLDSFLNKDEKDLKENLTNLLSQYREVNTKIEEIEREKKETLEKKEFYEYQLEEIEKLKIKITHADGEKCERCWKYDKLGSDPEHPTLCTRCAAVFK